MIVGYQTVRGHDRGVTYRSHAMAAGDADLLVGEQSCAPRILLADVRDDG
jgi:hypothetical protein